jgi:hypothetical protein
MTEEMVLKACKESCDRLGVTYCDLYYVHRLHPKVPVEQQARAMKAVLDSGLAKVPTPCCAHFSKSEIPLTTVFWSVESASVFPNFHPKMWRLSTLSALSLAFSRCECHFPFCECHFPFCECHFPFYECHFPFCGYWSYHMVEELSIFMD